MIDGKDASLSTKFNFECQKYMLECEQKLILDQISAEQYDDDEARDELISKYMINNHQICELERGIEDGFVRAFANKDKIYHKANYDKTKLFEHHVKSYIVNMDFDGMDASEITEQLKAGKYALDDVCTDIETITDTELNIVNLDDKKFTSIEEGVLLFTNPKKFYKKGSQEFDKIIDDLVALRQKMTEAENKYRADREHVYDAQALAREEKKVLDKMDAYLARKQREKNAGNDSRMARSRVEAMKAARDKLKARFDEDIATPDRSQERLLGAKGTAHIMKHGAEKLTVTNKVTGNELLEAAIFEEKHQREEYAKNVNKFRGDATKTERLFTSVKNTLYLQTIKDALGPKKGESKVQKRIKDDLIKEKLKNGISPETDKQMDKLMSTRFGNELFATVLEEITAEGADLSQENMIVLRDQALRKCYKDAMKQENANKKADVKEILEINQSLGSKELSREYDNYMKAQEAAKGKKAANLEGQNNIVNNNNQPDGIKM